MMFISLLIIEGTNPVTLITYYYTHGLSFSTSCKIHLQDSLFVHTCSCSFIGLCSNWQVASADSKTLPSVLNTQVCTLDRFWGSYRAVLFQIPLAIPSLMKRGSCSYLGYSNTHLYSNDVDNAVIIWKTKICRECLEGGCPWEMSAGSTFAWKQQGWHLHESLLHTMQEVMVLGNYGLCCTLIQWG